MKGKFYIQSKDLMLISRKINKSVKAISLFLAIGILPALLVNPIDLVTNSSSSDKQTKNQNLDNDNIDLESLFDEWNEYNSLNSDIKEN